MSKGKEKSYRKVKIEVTYRKSHNIVSDESKVTLQEWES